MRIKLRFFRVNLFCARDKLPRVAVLRPWDLIFLCFMSWTRNSAYYFVARNIIS